MLRISRDVVFHQRAVDAAPKGIKLQQTISERPSPTQPKWVAIPEVTWVDQTLYAKYRQRMVLNVARWFLQGIYQTSKQAK